jgi:hypothetical protein
MKENNEVTIYVVTMIDVRSVGLDMPGHCLTREEAEAKVARYALTHPAYRFTIREEKMAA